MECQIRSLSDGRVFLIATKGMYAATTEDRVDSKLGVFREMEEAEKWVLS
jgi:hypothetical protein